MKITDILKPESISLDTKGSSKKQILEEIAKSAALCTDCDSQVVFDALIERERLGTTGIGKGVAIPHARLSGLNDLHCAFFRTNGVDFESIDGKKVDLIFCLLVPEESGADHLKALAHISKLLRNDNVCSVLRTAATPKDILDIIAANDTDD